MGTVSITSVIGRASVLLNDSENIHWSQTELVDWLNDGQREIALYRPSACVVNKDVVLVVGAKQTLPGDARSLVDIPRNTNGYSIRQVDRRALDAIAPEWHLQAKAKARVEHFCYAETDPKTFYVQPPSPGGNSVEVIYYANPPAVGIGGFIAVDDVYASALVDYIAFRGMSKDTDYTPGGANAATAHYNAFLSAVKGQENQPAPRA
ncbi:MAG: DUF6682 family protein [Luteimonas sp.]